MTNKLISLVIIIFFLSIGRSYSDGQFLFPKEKPSIFKKISKDPGNSFSTNLPQKKPVLKSNVPEKDVVKEKNELTEKKTTEKKAIIVDSSFVFPQRKPTTYKKVSKEARSSTILNSKDFAKAKETFKFIKARKWNSAIKSAEKVKDRDREYRALGYDMETTQLLGLQAYSY